MTPEEEAALFEALVANHRRAWQQLNGPLPQDWILDVPFEDGTTPRQHRRREGGRGDEIHITTREWLLPC